MKLNEVKIHDSFYDKIVYYKKSSNRFALFDKNGVEINYFSITDELDPTTVNVIETVESYYSGYGVGFKVLHVKLDLVVGECGLIGDCIRKFGEPEVDG